MIGSALIYFTYESGQWIRELVNLDDEWLVELPEGVPEGEDMGLGATVDVDSRGMPHVTYRNISGATYYARRIDGTWEVYEVENIVGGSNTWVEVSLDGEGIPHIVWMHQEPGSDVIRYATLERD